MRVVVDPEAPPSAPAVPSGARLGSTAAALVGPLLIVGVVLFVLRGFVFQGLLTADHPDLLSFWLPRWSFLGDSIAQGHVPLWSPYEMAGYRFAADPQSGWLSAPPMLLFSLLPPAAAMAAMIALHPMLAGLGLFAFLRSEGLSRLAATAGGASVALLIAGSEIAISMPFSGSLAWTTVALLGASGWRRAGSVRAGWGWLVLTAFAWFQVTNAHLSHGLVVCSVLLVAYLLTHGVADVRAGRSPVGPAAARTLLLLVLLPVAALPVLLPRLDAIGASSLGQGYDRLGAGVGEVIGSDERPIQTNGVWAAWPFAHGAAPGAHLGTAMLLAIPLAGRSRRHRATALAFGGALFLVWALMLNAVVTAGWFRSLMGVLPFGDVYLHNPGRLRHAAVLALPVLAAIGLQALLDRPLPLRRLLPWLAGGLTIFAAVPLAAGGRPAAFALLLTAAVPAGAAIWAVSRSPGRAGWVLVVLLLVEGVVSASIGARFDRTFLTGMERGEHPNLVPQPLRFPTLSAAAYLREPPFVPLIGEDRYLTWAPPAAYYERGYLFAQRRLDWPALVMNRGTLFRIRDVLGYNPVQQLRYWTYVRATNRLPMVYNSSVIAAPSRQDVALLAVRHLIVPTGIASPVPGAVVASADGYDLVRVRDAHPLVSVVPDWRVVGGAAEALRAVIDPSFDPAAEVLLEAGPGGAPIPGAAAGSAAVRETDPEHLAIRVDAPAPSVVLVRVSFDEGWRATVDGAARRVFVADGFLMGVPVPAGRHEIRLTYEDDAVTTGLWLGAVVWLLLLAPLAVGQARAAVRRRWARPTTNAAP